MPTQQPGNKYGKCVAKVRDCQYGVAEILESEGADIKVEVDALKANLSGDEFAQLALTFKDRRWD